MVKKALKYKRTVLSVKSLWYCLVYPLFSGPTSKSCKLQLRLLSSVLWAQSSSAGHQLVKGTFLITACFRLKSSVLTQQSHWLGNRFSGAFFFSYGVFVWWKQQQMVQCCGIEQWGKIWPSDKLCVTGEQICWSATSKMLLLIEGKKSVNAVFLLWRVFLQSLLQICGCTFFLLPFFVIPMFAAVIPGANLEGICVLFD